MKDDRLVAAEKQLNEILKGYSDEHVGKIVKLKSGRYINRLAKIQSVIHWGGELQFLCMVLRSDGNGFLNSDAETRRYRSFEDFTIL